MEIKKCPRCRSKNLIFSGKGKDKVRKKCLDCTNHFTVVQKSTAIPKETIAKIYNEYSYQNFPISHYAKKGLVSHVTLNKWMKYSYWIENNISDNIFRSVARNNEIVLPITYFFKNVSPKIKVKPLEKKVLIQFLVDGYKTEIEKTLNLFTLFDFEEKFGESFCSVRFDILNVIKNKLPLFSNKEEKLKLIRQGKQLHEIINIENFINDELIRENEFNSDDLKIRKDRKNTIPHISVNDFVEYFLSEPNNFNLILKLSYQGLYVNFKRKTGEELVQEKQEKNKKLAISLENKK